MKSVDNAPIRTIGKPNAVCAALWTLREKSYARFLEFKHAAPDASILAIGGNRGGTPDNATVTLTWNPAGGVAQTAFAQLEPANSPRLFGLRQHLEPQSRQSKSGGLPFADGEFDWVFCDGVIEHIATLERQYLLLNELNRIARRGVFVTALNRWHPLEFHSGLPLIHWLPNAWWRRAVNSSGKGGTAGTAPLNLIGSKELKKLASLLPRSPTFNIGHIRHLGIKASFFLQVRKPPYDSN